MGLSEISQVAVKRPVFLSVLYIVSGKKQYTKFDFYGNMLLEVERCKLLTCLG